jgi:hypothetical protein
MRALVANVSLDRVFRVPRRTLVSLAVGSLVLLTGCGSSSPTRAQYVASADTICRSAAAQTAPVVAQVTSAAAALSSTGQSAGRQLVSGLQSLHAITRSSLAKLRALAQPASGRATIQRFLSGYESLSVALGRAATAASNGAPQQALAQLREALSASYAMGSAARAADLSRCASPLLAVAGTSSKQAIHARLVAENHHPRVNTPWRYSVIVTDAQGNKLSGTETTHYTFNHVIVGTEQPQNVKFAHGVYRDTIRFPAAAVGHPLEVQVVIRVGAGSVTLYWPIEVLR